MRIKFFKSRKVTWKQGIYLKRVRWHSCMQWGWPAINSGQHLARYSDYWVFTICWRHYGVCWHFYPKSMNKQNTELALQYEKETRLLKKRMDRR